MLEEVLKNKYNLDVNRIEKNEESTVGNVYMLYCKNSKYVVKIYSEVNHTKSIVNLHEMLNKNNFYVPKIIKNIENQGFTEIKNRSYIVIYSFLEGHQITWNKTKINLSDEEITMLAKTLRKLHNLTDNSIIKLPQIPFGDYKKRQSILHFDLTKQNIFINNDKIGFIDFDDAKFGEAICDIAILIANLFFSKTRGVNLEGAKKFINSYYLDDLQLKNEEISKIKDYGIKWIDYVLAGNEFDTSTTESFHVKRKLIKKYLDSVK